MRSNHPKDRFLPSFLISKYFSLLWASLVILSCSTAREGQLEVTDTYRLAIDSIMSTHPDFNGGVLVTRDSRVLYSKMLGYSDLEEEVDLQPNDLFVIGSISKQITAVMVLREWEKGRFLLTDTIGKYVENIPSDWAKVVTIHHLLTHTHGIVELDGPLAFEAGSQFQYSQLGYDLLAQILEKITGKSFRDLSEGLFDEYELLNTHHPETNYKDSIVKGYGEANDHLQEVESSRSLRNYAAAGSFISDLEDLNRWNYLLHSGKLVQDSTLSLMKIAYATRNHPIFEEVDYGYGLLFLEGESDIQIGALGYAPGFVSASYYQPKTDISLVVLSNVARQLDDFPQTFNVHVELMNYVKGITFEE
ncbi:MAG: serine hydrolase domain-containing protein [Bacteroidota bacterium]